MPRFFFHSSNGTGGPLRADTIGTELADLSGAREEATDFLAETLKGNPDKLWATGQWRVDVTDADGTSLFSITTVAAEASDDRATS